MRGRAIECAQARNRARKEEEGTNNRGADCSQHSVNGFFSLLITKYTKSGSNCSCFNAYLQEVVNDLHETFLRRARAFQAEPQLAQQPP